MRQRRSFTWIHHHLKLFVVVTTAIIPSFSPLQKLHSSILLPKCLMRIFHWVFIWYLRFLCQNGSCWAKWGSYPIDGTEESWSLWTLSCQANRLKYFLRYGRWTQAKCCNYLVYTVFIRWTLEDAEIFITYNLSIDVLLKVTHSIYFQVSALTALLVPVQTRILWMNNWIRGDIFLLLTAFLRNTSVSISNYTQCTPSLCLFIS